MTLRKLLAPALLVASGCAQGPAAVRGMDAAQIQEISDYRLCDAAAVGLDLQRQRFPVVENEIGRRGVSCEEHIAAIVSDCSMLQVVGVDTKSLPDGALFTVRNSSDRTKNFRIYRQGIQSSLLTIAAGQTQPFAVSVDPNLKKIGAAIATVQGGGDVELNECRTVPGSQQFRYRPQKAGSSEAVAANELAPQASSPEQGLRSRATRNVNMRLGPGAHHAIAGLLREGEIITVRRAVGDWCESVTSDSQRVYISCGFLSPPSGGWATVQIAGTGRIPTFRANTPYPEVRRQLLSDGWQPFRLSGRYVTRCPDNFSSSCSGFAETVFCTGIGRNSCWYTYRRGNEYLLAVAEGESRGGAFAELRKCSTLIYSENGHPWQWCSPVATRLGSGAAQSRLASATNQIRLTRIQSTAGGSNCSLYLEKNQETLVGEAEYSVPMIWKVGINGRVYRLAETSIGRSLTHLSSQDGAIKVDIDKERMLRLSKDPSRPSSFSSVTVRITISGRSIALPAFQFCGEG